MLQKTLGNRIILVLVNCALLYLFSTMTIIGLLPFFIDRARQRIRNHHLATSYSLFCGCLFTGLYTWVIVSQVVNQHVQFFYAGAGRVTWIILCLCSLLVIASFYSINLINRFRLCRFYNQTMENYQKFTAFYTGSIRFGVIGFQNIEGEDELYQVYMRVFFKTGLVHGLVLLSIYGISVRASIVGGVDTINMATFYAMPYIIKSVTSSYLYLGAIRANFLFRKLDGKLKEIRSEMRDLTRSKKSRYEKMSRFCEMSDLIDQLSLCYEKISQTSKEQIAQYKLQICLVLLFSVINTLHGMFSQFLVIARAMSGDLTFDIQLFCYNLSFIFLNVLEILMLVNVTGACHRGSVRVGKTVQGMMYFEDLDSRLKQSVSGSVDWMVGEEFT